MNDQGKNEERQINRRPSINRSLIVQDLNLRYGIRKLFRV